LSCSTGPASRSIHTGVAEMVSASSRTSPRARRRWATWNAARSAAPRPGTPWKGTATRSPAGASCSTITDGSEQAPARSRVSSEEPASATISAARPTPSAATPAAAAARTSSMVSALL
jgi:hypothetical protein